MSSVRIRWIIGLMTVALLGLVAFQGYWLNSVITANEEEFKRNVMASLREVSQKLEQIEALHILKEQARQQQFYQQIRSQTPVIIDQGTNNTVVFRWGDTIQGQEGGFEFSYIMEATSEDPGLYEDKTLESNIKQRELPEKPDEKALIEEEEALHNQQKRLQDAVEKMSRRSETMITVMEEMMLPKQILRKRIDREVVDSLLRNELANRGINLGYEFGVLQPQRNRFVALTNPNSQQKLLESGFQVNLFPNDVMNDLSYLLVDFPGKNRYLKRKILLTVSSSGILMLIILGVFAYAIQIILKQKKLSEMKTDFINNMTHELKTPIATIGLAVEALQDNAIQQVDTMRHRYLGMIGEENKRLGSQVERVLQMARIDRNEIKLNKEELDLHSLINDAVEKISLQVEHKRGETKTILNADRSNIYADETHMLNVLLNLLENAIKYSKEAPSIMVRTESFKNYIQLYVKDRGVGMKKEAIKHIFDKFYRVPTGNVHDVKGYGLGLPYVKSIIEEHGGSINVESEPGKGSNFIIKLPLSHE